MEQLISQLTSSFDITLLFSLTITTYITLKIIDFILKKSPKITINNTTKVIKHIVTAIVGIGICVGYYKLGELTLKQIIPTYLLTTAFYDIILKKVLTVLNIGYSKPDNAE